MTVVFVVTKSVIVQREVVDQFTPDEAEIIKEAVKKDCVNDWNLVLPVISSASTHGIQLPELNG